MTGVKFTRNGCVLITDDINTSISCKEIRVFQGRQSSPIVSKSFRNNFPSEHSSSKNIVSSLLSKTNFGSTLESQVGQRMEGTAGESSPSPWVSPDVSFQRFTDQGFYFVSGRKNTGQKSGCVGHRHSEREWGGGSCYSYTGSELSRPIVLK